MKKYEDMDSNVTQIYMNEIFKKKPNFKEEIMIEINFFHHIERNMPGL